MEHKNYLDNWREALGLEIALAIKICSKGWNVAVSARREEFSK
jgi:hypothetical protein